GSRGGESEGVLGRWRRSRGVGGEIVVATTCVAEEINGPYWEARERAGVVAGARGSKTGRL
ncbi:aldo/keto reductase, partial [Streptomyces sp. NPDC001939]